MTKAEMGIARNKGAQAIALQFIAKKGVETTLFTNIMSYNGNAALFLNGSPIKLSGRKAVLPARPGVNRLVMRIPVVPGRYTKPIQTAVCENGRLGAPCGCVPFVCHGE